MIKKFLYLFILVLFIYSVVLIATPYYYCYSFKSDLEETLRLSNTDKHEEVMTKIIELTKKYNIPVEEKDIKLRYDRRFTAEVSWEETIDFFPIYKIYQKTFKFYIDTSK